MSTDTLSYVDYDFDNLVQQFIDRVQRNAAWQDTYRSATGQMLIELHAYVANLVLYYIERRAVESYIGTARLKSSVVNIVKLLGYNPKRKVSSTGVLTFSIAAAHTKNVYIPKYTECASATGVKFVTSEDGVIIAGQTSVAVNAIQGELIQVNKVASGDVDAEYLIDSTQVENTNISVFIDGEEWTAVSSFISSTSTSKHYVIRAEMDDTITVVFGDNQYGKAPANGSTVLIQYVKSDGIDGNVYETGRITTLSDTIYDADSAQITTTVSNTSLFLGGDDEESIEEIRSEAPRVFSTGERAVIRADFIAILDNYAGVASSNAWGENEETNPDYDHYNQVKICILLQEWELPDATFKATLGAYLYTKSMMTVRYSWVDATILQLIPMIDIYVVDGYTLSEVQAAVEDAIDAQFTLGTTSKLGVAHRYSDIVAAIEAVSGVSYIHLTIEIYQELEAIYDSFYEYGATLYGEPIKELSVRVFVNDDQIAVDDGIGGFTNQSSDYTITGEINYTTGYIGIDIVPDLSSGDVLSVRYQQDNSGDIVVGLSEISKILDIEVPVLEVDE